MNDESPANRLRQNATEAATIAVTGLWMFGLFTGQSWWLAVLIVGYAAFVPLVALLYGDESDRTEWVEDWWGDSWWGESDEEVREEQSSSVEPATNRRDALETLRERYARGELTDEQFERKLDRLLDTETIEDIEDRTRERERERA